MPARTAPAGVALRIIPASKCKQYMIRRTKYFVPVEMDLFTAAKKNIIVNTKVESISGINER